MIAVDQFRRLLGVLGLDETIALKALDWMDADNLPQPAGGAEDEAYTRLFPPYPGPEPSDGGRFGTVGGRGCGR